MYKLTRISHVLSAHVNPSGAKHITMPPKLISKRHADQDVLKSMDVRIAKHGFFSSIHSQPLTEYCASVRERDLSVPCLLYLS